MSLNTNKVKKERNDGLIADYKSGKFSIVDLITKYRISSARIFELLKREGVKTILKTYGKN